MGNRLGGGSFLYRIPMAWWSDTYPNQASRNVPKRIEVCFLSVFVGPTRWMMMMMIIIIMIGTGTLLTGQQKAAMNSEESSTITSPWTNQHTLPILPPQTIRWLPGENSAYGSCASCFAVVGGSYFYRGFTCPTCLEVPMRTFRHVVSWPGNL